MPLTNRLRRDFRQYCQFRSWSNNSKLLAFSTTLYLLFLYTILLEQVGFVLPFARPVLAAVLISFVPGALVLALLDMRLDRPEALGYAVGVSLALTMGVNFVLNQLYLSLTQFLFLPKPFSLPVQLIGTTCLIGGLTLGVGLSDKNPALPCLPSPRLSSSSKLLMVLQLPLWAAVAAAVLDRQMMSVGLVAVLVALSATPLLVVRLDEAHNWIFLWFVGLALLLQNTLVMRFLRGGDGQYEFYFANLTLTRGFWEPSIARTMNSLLSITILRPSYAVLGDLDLMLVFKIVYPLTFSVVAIVLYRLYEREFDPRIAVFSVLLYMFLHPFFTTLSRNTRTGTALFFLALLILTFTDDRLPRRTHTVFTMLFLFSLLVSHYGVTTIALFLLASTAVLDLKAEHRPKNLKSIYVPVLLLGIVVFAWYRHASSGLTFALLARIFVRDVLLGLDQFLTAQSTATEATSVNLASFTYKFIRFEFLVLSLTMGVGVLTAMYSRWIKGTSADPSGNTPTTQERTVFFQLLALAGLGLLVVAFAPVGVFGIGRIYVIAALFLTPYAVLAVQLAFRTLSVPSLTAPTLAVVLGVLLLINSGVAAATVFEERSTQPNIDRDRILTEGSDWEMYHLYARYTTGSDYRSAQWLLSYKRTDQPIYGSGFQFTGGISLVYTGVSGRKPPGDYNALTGDTVGTEAGYIYLTEYTVRTQQFVPRLRVQSPNFQQVELMSFDEARVELSDRVYDNGHSKNHWLEGDSSREITDDNS